jgi:hypothetical protein
VHAYNLALRDLGKSLGIPGYQNFFNDNIFNVAFDANEILELFRKTYTLNNIIHGWILPLVKDDHDFKNNYIDLQIEVIKKSLRDAGQDPNNYEDFMMQKVYDEKGQFSVAGVFYLLSQIGVIDSTLK